MILLFGLALGNGCSPTRTFQVTTSTGVIYSDIPVSAANPSYCINVTAPHVAVSFHSLPDGFVRVYRGVSSQEVLCDNISSAPNKLFMVDFGSDTGLLEFQSLHQSQLSYSLIRYPPRCHSHITSSVRADIFQLDENCTHDGCLLPQSTICYFNALWGTLHYSIATDLVPDQAYLTIISPQNEPRELTGVSHLVMSVTGKPDYLYFILNNTNPLDRLRWSISVNVTGNPSVDRTGIRGRLDSGGIKIFHENDIGGEGLPLPSAPPFFMLGSVLFLCLVIASGAFILMSERQKEASPPASKTKIENIDDVFPMPRRQRSSTLDDGNPDDIPRG
jgi:hypothetical protein